MEGITLTYYLICIAWYTIFVITILYLNYKYNLEYPHNFKNKIYPLIPSFLNPGELSNLMYRRIRPDAFAATILILIKKEVLSLKKNDDNYFLVLNKKHDARLSSSQRHLIDFLFNIVGERDTVSFKKLEEICNSSSGCSSFLMNYQIWIKMMYKESSKKIFFEQKTGYSKIKIIEFMGVLLFLANIIGGYHLILGYFLIIPALFISFFFYKIYKRTRSANEEYYKWLAFKNFLQQIEHFKYDKAEIDTYLIYGLLLNVKGLEKKITKYEYIDNLNSIINRCVVKANLFANRTLFKDGL